MGVIFHSLFVCSSQWLIVPGWPPRDEQTSPAFVHRSLTFLWSIANHTRVMNHDCILYVIYYILYIIYYILYIIYYILYIIYYYILYVIYYVLYNIFIYIYILYTIYVYNILYIQYIYIYILYFSMLSDGKSNPVFTVFTVSSLQLLKHLCPPSIFFWEVEATATNRNCHVQFVSCFWCRSCWNPLWKS